VLIAPLSNLTIAPSRTKPAARSMFPESGQAGRLQAEERGLGFFLSVGVDGTVAVGHLSVEVDGGDVVAERLVAARDVDLGALIVGAGQERILVVSECLVELARGELVAAALARDRLDVLVAAAPSGGRGSWCIALILIRLEGFELLLLMLELFLLLLNQLVGGVDLIAHASRADERENPEYKCREESFW